MHQRFQSLRNKLVENEKLFKWFLIGFLVITILIGFDKFLFHYIDSNIATISFSSSWTSLTVFFLGFLNYRTKVGVHDMLVDLYENAPPPPKLTLANMLKENSNFKPFKFKL